MPLRRQPQVMATTLPCCSPPTGCAAGLEKLKKMLAK
jgi:hypothetical protein